MVAISVLSERKKCERKIVSGIFAQIFYKWERGFWRFESFILLSTLK